MKRKSRGPPGTGLDLTRTEMELMRRRAEESWEKFMLSTLLILPV